MKKRMRLLAAVSVLALLLSACGTPLYVMTDEEEELVVQGAAYLVSKHNIYQKDGMNAAQPEQETETEEETETQQDSESDSQELESSDMTSSGSTGGEATTSGGTISLAESIGYADELEVSYEGYSLMDVYQEGSYFSLDADDGDTFIVMEFTIRNSGQKDITIDNYNAGYAFYCSFGAVSNVSEKRSFITDSLSAYEGTVAAGDQASAVLIFEITKDQAEQMDDLTLTMEKDHTSYSVQL